MAKMIETEDRLTITGDESTVVRLTRAEVRALESTGNDTLDEALDEAQGQSGDATAYLIIEIAQGDI